MRDSIESLSPPPACGIVAYARNWPGEDPAVLLPSYELAV